MTTLAEKLENITSNKPSGWYAKAKSRQQNRDWLLHSGHIARRVLAAIENTEGMNQKKLAEIIGVSPQQISKIVKGQENLTLDTIARLSKALGVELIHFPESNDKQMQATAAIQTATRK